MIPSVRPVLLRGGRVPAGVVLLAFAGTPLSAAEPTAQLAAVSGSRSSSFHTTS